MKTRRASGTRFVTAAEAVSRIEAGNRIYLSYGAGEPPTLQAALFERLQQLERTELVGVFLANRFPFASPELDGRVYARCFLSDGGLKRAFEVGRAGYIPVHVSQIPGLLAGPLRPDVALIHLSPTDSDGYMTFGAHVETQPAAADSAGLIIAEVNRQMPVTHGSRRIHVSEVDLIVESDQPLVTVDSAAPGDVERRVAARVSCLIPDGATVQIGVGVIPQAVTAAMAHHRNLRLHTGMFGAGAQALLESGAVTGPAVATCALGPQELYQFLHRNDAIRMEPSTYTHDCYVLGNIPRFCAVNSALEVDLTGQANLDNLGGRPFAGIGGQLDFVRGAARSPGGVAILALPSTVHGRRSRIVAHLAAAAGSPRVDGQFVVTEHGVADLRGKTLAERARAMLAIADPAFQAELEKDATTAGYT